MGGQHLNQPIVGMAATPDGKGYWLVAADGGIFSYGDAQFFGSTGAITLNSPIVGMAATRDGKGYWLVAADGGIFNYGDALFEGSAGDANLPDPAIGMVASPDGAGYLIATQNGVVLPYGDAQAYGGLSLDPTATQISAIIGNNHGTGYWLLDPQAWQYSFIDRDARTRIPRVGHHRGGGGEPDRAGSGHAGGVLQPVRAVRAVVRAVRHLGLGAGRYRHSPLRLHGRHVRLVRRPRCRPAADRDARRRRRGALRHRAAERVHLGARGHRDPGLARRRDHDRRRRLGPGPRRVPVGRTRRALPADGLGSYNGTPIYAFAQP